MNRNRISRIAKTALVTAGLSLGLISCSSINDYTVGYVYVTSNKSTPGVIDQYGIDFLSGALLQVGKPIQTGTNPVTLVSTPDGLAVYVVNKGDNAVQEFLVHSDGTLAAKTAYPVGGVSPTAATVNSSGNYLFVTYTYQTGYSASNPGPGGVAVFPINSDHSLGTVQNFNVGNNPVSVVASYFNHFVYVLDQEPSPNATILGFSQNTTTGALTALPGTSIKTVAGKTVAVGYPAGVVPSAIAEEQTSRFLYATDQIANQLIGYVVQASGDLIPMVNGPFAAGNFPIDLTIDPRGKLIYVVDYNSNSVQGYAIDAASGTPSPAVGAFATGTGAGPTCVAIDPSLGEFLYVSDNQDQTVTAEKLTPETGALGGVQNSPFLTSGSPTCLTIVPNGPHATQIYTP